MAIAAGMLLTAVTISPSFSAESVGGALPTREEIQAAVMSFADTWGSQTGEAANKVAEHAGTAAARRHADQFKYYGLAAAYDIASHPNAGVNLLDMMVLTSLNRMVWEEYWEPKVYGTAAEPMIDMLRMMEADVWEFAGEVMTPMQLRDVKDVIAEWRAKNPDKKFVHFIRFNDFGELGRKSSLEGAMQPGGLLGPVREAAEAAEEIKIWGDRALFLLIRMQELMILRLEMAMKALLRTPEMTQTLEDFSGIRNSADQLPMQAESIIEQTVTHVSAERQAAINQFLLGIGQERQLAIEQLTKAATRVRAESIDHALEGFSQERAALNRDIEQLVERAGLEAETVATHLFVLGAALLLTYFLLRTIFHYATACPATTWYGKFTPALALFVVAVAVIAAVLIYVNYSSLVSVRSIEPVAVGPVDMDDEMRDQEPAPRLAADPQREAAGNTNTIRGSETDSDLSHRERETRPALSRDDALPTSNAAIVDTPSDSAHAPLLLSTSTAIPKVEGRNDVMSKALQLNQEIVTLRVLFARASTEVTRAFYPNLDEVSEILVNNPEFRGEIRGHADSRGVASANQRLSEERAKAVARYLTKRGVTPDRLWILGYGSGEPVASNETVEGRAKNRRVEISVIR